MPITLMDSEPPKRHGILRRFLLLWILIIAVAGALLYALFHNYPEEHAVARFLTTLQQGNYEEAYRLWQPGRSYTLDDFRGDWGERGDYGKIREFQIVGSRSRGSNTVVVTVRINNVSPTLDLLVDRRTKGLAYSVY